jgi:hypothetical protein
MACTYKGWSRFIAFGTTLFCLVFFACAEPVTSMGTITLSGSASGLMGFFSGSYCTITSAPGQTGASISEDAPQMINPPPDFVGAAQFGNLAGGDGSPSVATFSFRECSNVACHTSASVASYTATNLSYNSGSGSRQLQGNASELSFVTLGNGAVTAAQYGNAGGHSYGSKFQGTATLNALNSGSIGPVSSTDDEFDSFSSPPSNSGNFTSGNNYVQDSVTFSVPTGFVWSPSDNTSTGSFSLALQFEIYASP